MDEKKLPLPQPGNRPFGTARPGEVREGQTLMADALAMAAAEGRLDEFIKREMPDSEHARSLVAMMMGMTGMAGMAPPQAAGRPEAEKGPVSGDALPPVPEEAEPPPPEVVRAIEAGDVAGLMGLLKKEHERRAGVPAAEADAPASQPVLQAAEQEVIDRLVAIAAQNGLTVDWLVLRALKLYVEEYRKTGRL